jgi:hypothetical protein
MAERSDDVVTFWCMNAYQPEKPVALADVPNCGNVGPTFYLDPEQSWSGYYCDDCAKLLGWEPVTPSAS